MLIVNTLFFSLVYHRKTKYKKLVVCLQYPDDYPNNPIIIEIKSKTLPEKLCNGFTNICDAEAKKAVGKPHVSCIRAPTQWYWINVKLTDCSVRTLLNIWGMVQT